MKVQTLYQVKVRAVDGTERTSELFSRVDAIDAANEYARDFPGAHIAFYRVRVRRDWGDLITGKDLVAAWCAPMRYLVSC